MAPHSKVVTIAGTAKMAGQVTTTAITTVTIITTTTTKNNSQRTATTRRTANKETTTRQDKAQVAETTQPTRAATQHSKTQTQNHRREPTQRSSRASRASKATKQQRHSRKDNTANNNNNNKEATRRHPAKPFTAACGKGSAAAQIKRQKSTKSKQQKATQITAENKVII